MDGNRFDVISRRIGAPNTRRGALRAVGSFILAAVGLTSETPEEATAREGARDGQLGGRHDKNRRGRHRKRHHGDKKDNRKGNAGKCKEPSDCGPPPGPCQFLQCSLPEGRCSFPNFSDGSSCGEGDKVCRDGQCVAAECSSAADCAPPGTCQQVACVHRFCAYSAADNGSSCGGANQCRDGTCLTPPTCKGWDELTDSSCANCCCGCLGINGQHTCERCIAGAPCHQNHDCFGKTSNTIGRCIAFVCHEE